MKMRRARESEAEQLSALARAAKAQWGYSAAVLQSWRSQLTLGAVDIRERPTFVIERGEDIAGFYTLVPAANIWALDNLWVAPAYTRQGIGRRLLAHALEFAARHGVAQVSVDADPNAEAFYLRCGAERRGAISAPIPGEPDRVRPQLFFTLRPPAGG